MCGWRLGDWGFDDSGSWDDYIDGLDAGWTFFLFNLKHALERHRGVDRQQLSARFRTTARAGEEHPVFGRGASTPAAAGLSAAWGRATRVVSHSAASMSTPPWPCGTRSRTIAFVVPAWNDALLFVEREGMKETQRTGRLAVAVRRARRDCRAAATGTGRPAVGNQRTERMIFLIPGVKR